MVVFVFVFVASITAIVMFLVFVIVASLFLLSSPWMAMKKRRILGHANGCERPACRKTKRAKL